MHPECERDCQRLGKKSQICMLSRAVPCQRDANIYICPDLLGGDSGVPTRSAQEFQTFVVVGIDHRSATIAQRERVAFRSDELPIALSRLADIVQEGFIL